MTTRARGDDAGAAVLEYVGILLAVAALVVVVAGTVGPFRPVVAEAASCAWDTVLGGGGGDCGGTGDDGTDDSRAADLLDRLDDLALYASSGSETADLAQQVRDAVDAGHLDLAESLLDQLALYEDLVGTDPRGQYLSTLFGASDSEFLALREEGTIYFDGGAYNTTYFQLDDPPGGGVVVMDYFIDSGTSGGLLKGDDRDHQDPLRGDVPLDESRMMLVVDLETGRGQVYVTETCTAGIRVCNEPRPNVLDGSIWSNDTGTRPLIPILPNDFDIANQFTFTNVDGGFQLQYDALNGIIPVGSVDGTVSVHVDGDGNLAIGEDDRDNYPSIGTYYYSQPGETQVVEQREQEGVVCGALPVNIC